MRQVEPAILPYTSPCISHWIFLSDTYIAEGFHDGDLCFLDGHSFASWPNGLASPSLVLAVLGLFGLRF